MIGSWFIQSQCKKVNSTWSRTNTCQLKPTSTTPTSPSKFHLAYGIDELKLSIAHFGTSFSYRIAHQTHNLLLEWEMVIFLPRGLEVYLA